MSREKARRRGFKTIPPVPVQSGITVQVHAGQALTITGPNGFSQLATFGAIQSNTITQADVVYRVIPPGGTL